MTPTQTAERTPETEQVERDMAIHEAVEAILKLFRIVGRESAHWISTSAIIAGEREANRERWS